MTRRLKMSLTALALAALLALSIAACGSSDDSTSASANAVDEAFVNEMIPHHELAVQMAKIAQDRGQHPEILGLADDIVSTQEDELTQMRTVQGELSGSSGDSGSMDGMDMSGGMHDGHATSADAKTLGISMDEMGMSMDVGSLKTADPFDRAFIEMMVPHHQGAVTMAKVEVQKGKNPDLVSLARRIISAQNREISEMQAWFVKWYPMAPAMPSAG